MTRTRQLPLHLPLRPNYSAQDYIVSTYNWEAMGWIERWPDWPMKMIAIYGDPGCGKTHLAHIWQEKSRARFLTPNDLVNMTPLDATNSAQSIVLDDADNLFQKDGTPGSVIEDWMFHFYNLMKEKGADLLLCCRQPPTQWKVTLPDLRSRLATILSVAVNSPDEDALQTVLFKLCSERGMTLSSEATDYILRRVERSFESVRLLVETLDQYTLSTHRQPTLALVRQMFIETDK